MSNIPSPGQIYKHFRGNLYRIVTLAKHTETGEELVIYQALYGNYEVYARPLAMFTEKLDRETYPEADSEYRFTLQEELIQPSVPSSVRREEWGERQPEQKEKELSMEEVKTPFEEETSSEESSSMEEEELNIDPLVLEFLDAGSHGERLNILSALQHRITDEMINTMAMAVDVEIGEGDTEDRLAQLRTCLMTFEKYECNRLR